MLAIAIERLVQNLRRQGLASGVIKNHIKEYIQFHILDFIYNSELYNTFIFTGGTCLRICYGLNRLSEDIDFDLLKEIDVNTFTKDICDHFSKKLQYKNVETTIKGKNNKIYLKLPILRNLGLASTSESDKLYVKIETSICSKKKVEAEFTPIDHEQLNFLIRHYNLSALMAGKINAIFNRVYFKGKENEITFKGRDIYDLVWYLERGTNPDMDIIKDTLGIDSEKELFEKIYNKVSNYNPEYLMKDLENLFDNRNFIKRWSENYKEILLKAINKRY